MSRTRFVSMAAMRFLECVLTGLLYLRQREQLQASEGDAGVHYRGPVEREGIEGYR